MRVADYHRLSAVRGLRGMGDESRGGLKFADNAVIAPQFEQGKPGRYAIDVVVVGVPISADKRPFFDVSEWNAALSNAGHGNVTVERVEYVVTSNTNARSTGGSWDVFGWGVDVADYTYRLTMSVGDSGGMSGMGAITTLGWVVIAAAVVAVNLLIYKLTGVDAIITTVKWLGKLLGAAGGAALEPVLSLAVPVLVIAGIALFAFSKMGGRVRTPAFSVGKG